MKVNDEKIDVTAGTYAEIHRKWEPDDKIGLALDMRCRVLDAPHGSNRAGDNFQAVIYGPVVLARDENRDEHYLEPVKLQVKNGYIETRQVDPANSNSKLEFSVPVGDGEFITMVDYASIDNWSNGKHVCAWLPMKE